MNAMLNITIRVNAAQAAAQVRQLQGAVNQLGTVAGGGATRGLNTMNGGFAAGNLAMQKFGKNLQWTGRQLEYNFTLPLVLAGAAATKFALDNEAAMVGVRKVYGDLGDTTHDLQGELKALERSFELLSSRFGVHQSEVINIGAAWAQAGAEGVALAKATRLTLEAMMIGEMDAARATEGLIAVQSAYRLNTTQLHDALADLNIVENQTAINFEGLIDVITRAGGVAQTAGIDIEHLAAMAASLVPATGSAAQAGNALRTMISRIMAPTQDAAEMIGLMGINVYDASWQALDGVQRIERLADAFVSLSDAQQTTVSATIASRWQINRFDILMRDIVSTTGAYQKALEATSDQERANATYAQELATILSSTPRAFKILTTNIQNALARAIMPLLPALVSLLSLITRATTWFANLDPNVRQLAMTFLLMLALVGPITRYFGSFILLGTTIAEAFLWAGTRLFGFTAAQRAAAAASGVTNLSLIQQHGIIGSLLIGLRNLILLPFKPFAFMLSAVWAGFTMGAQGAITATGGVFRALAGAPFALIGSLMGSMWDMFTRGLLLAWQGFTSFVVWLSGPVLGLLRTAGVAMGSALVTGLTAAWRGAAAIVAGIGPLIGGMFSAVLTTASNFGALFVAIVNRTGSMTQAIWATVTMGIRGLWVGLAGIAAPIGAAIANAWAASAKAVRIGWVLVQTFVIRSWFLLQYAAVAASTAVNAAWVAAQKAFQIGWVLVQTFVIRSWYLLQTAAAAAGGFVALAWQTAARAAMVAWQLFAAFMQSLPALARIIWVIIVATWKAGYAALQAASIGFTAFMQGISAVWALIIANPIAAAVIAVIAILGTLAYVFRDKIVNGIQRAFNSLPEGIKNTLMSVVNMIKSFALAVYEWLSYINPFARHSPSLVDNVTRGVSTILDQYSRLSGVADIIRRAARAQAEFAASVGQDRQLSEMQQQKSDIVAVTPEAAGAVDNMISSIMEMYDALGLVNQELDAQARLVDDMQRQIDESMKPYNDAIYENEMAQKKLRLEILKMKQAGQSIDDIKKRMAALAGEIEGLRGQREDLRLAGAGSDVLGAYDAQIAALEKQHDALEGIGSPIDDLQNQLQALQDQAEMVQLERDLRFDPQLRELDMQKEKLSELQDAYGDIKSAISDMESALREASTTAKQASDDLSNNAALFAGGVGADFTDVGGDTIPGLGREGGLPEIEDFNAQLEAELASALEGMGGFDMFAPFKDMWNSAWAWIKDNVWPVLQPVWDAIVGFFSGIDWSSLFGGGGGALAGVAGMLGDAFGAVSGILGGLWEILQSVGGFLADVFGPVFSWLGGVVSKAAKTIWKELKNWAPLFDDVVEAAGHIANAIEWAFNTVIVPVIKIALGIILGLWQFVWPILKNVLTPIIDAIVGVIRAAMEIIRGIIQTVLGIINGDWSAVWNGILTVVDGIWDAIYSVISGAIGLIVGIVRGLIEGIIGFFQWLWDVLVGHSIIPDMMNAIVWWFEFILAPIKAVWDFLWGIIKWAWENIGVPVFNGIKWVLNNVVVPAFNSARDLIGSAFSAIWGGIQWAWNNVISPIFEALKTGIGAVGTAMSWVKDHVIVPVWNAIRDAISTAWSAIAGILEGGINFFIDAFNLLARAINAVADALGLGFHIAERGHISLGGGGGGGGGRIPTRGAFAQGGIPVYEMGNHAGFRTNVPTAIVGEGNSAYPEWVIPTDPAYRKRALALFASLGSRILGAGDILGGAWDATGGKVVSGAADLAGGAADLATGAWDSTVGVARAFWDAINRVWDIVNNISGAVWDIAKSVVDKVVDWGKDKIGDVARGIRDTAWDVGAVLNPADDIMNWVGLYQGGVIPQLAHGGRIPPRPGGTLVNVAEKGRGEAIVYPLDDDDHGKTEYHFHGDLSFPNITKPEDASKFLNNLKDLAG